MALCAALSVAPTAAAEGDGWATRTADHLSGIALDGDTEVFLPFLTYHLRYAYTPEKIASYEESPLGFGIGRGRFLDDGNWAGLFVMGFQDSHSRPQWLAGYGWQKIWNTGPGIRIGLGYTAFLTARTDINHYQPTPAILPLASIGYGNLSIEGTFVPGGTGYGNILFFWAKWRPDHKESP
ncbi:MAG TPA: lipid IV(A) palmitoyltransferase PagP [Rhodocyclaceae bacterium]